MGDLLDDLTALDEADLIARSNAIDEQIMALKAEQRALSVERRRRAQEANDRAKLARMEPGELERLRALAQRVEPGSIAPTGGA